MTKLIFVLVFTIANLIFTPVASAANTDISIDIETPKTPTNQDTIDINFVALDILGRAMTARCYKKGPSDATFSQFGSNIALSAGGDTSNCSLTSSILNTNGVYQFYVTVAANGDLATSPTVSLDYNTDGPGTPTDYSKSRPDSCNYDIHFKTADDGGKTTKVEIYRSDSTSFSADSGTRVGTISIGSDQEKNFISNAPDCSKDYYFAVRAFDSAGNGSGIIGDSLVTITTPTTTVVTTASPVPAAIPLTSPGGVILGEEETTLAVEEGSELPLVSPEPKVLGIKKNLPRNLGILGLVILASIYALARKKKQH